MYERDQKTEKQKAIESRKGIYYDIFKYKCVVLSIHNKATV